MSATNTGAGAQGEAAEPDFGPTLPQLLGLRLRALGRWQRLALALALAALVAGAAVKLVRSQAATKTYSESAADARAKGLPPIPFNFDHSSRLRISTPPGTYVRAERRIDGTLVARFTVSPLRLTRESGLVSGFLPIVATRHERRAARSYDAFRLVFEGRARVNEVEGYQFAFTARLKQPGRPARQLFGRVVMLPEPFDMAEPGDSYPEGTSPTRGLVITMLATSLDNVPSATRVGDEGILQRPYRSFRFGAN